MAAPNWGERLPDMLDMSDQQLADIAATVFLRGLKDARELSGPITADKLMEWLPGYPHRLMHNRKLRQVYGAAFDMMKAHANIKAKGW
jgi:hypothetical protein